MYKSVVGQHSVAILLSLMFVTQCASLPPDCLRLPNFPTPQFGIGVGVGVSVAVNVGNGNGDGVDVGVEAEVTNANANANAKAYADAIVLLEQLNPAQLCPEDFAKYESLRRQISGDKREPLPLPAASLQSSPGQPIPQRTTPSVNQSLVADGEDDEETPTYSDNGLIPLYCGVMGLVIILSVAYAVFKQRKQYIKKKKAKAAAADCRPIVSVHTTTSICPTTVSLASASANESVLAGAFEPLLAMRSQPPPCWYKQTKSSFVNDYTIDKLCAKMQELGSGSDGVEWWKRLAFEMNFDDVQVLTAEAYSNASPLWYLLVQLAHSPDSWLTQAVLASALERIGKADLCSSLQLAA